MLIQSVVTTFLHMEKKHFFLLYFILDDHNEDKAAVNMSSTTSDAFAPWAVKGKAVFQGTQN